MEVLSPRPANIQIKAHPTTEKPNADAAADAAERALKDKEHAPAPPEWVIQPPMRAGGLSEKFRSGKYLGKGGFAICHEGSLGAKKYAMKIVRAKMHQKKTEEKVRSCSIDPYILATNPPASFVLSYRSTPSYDIQALLNFIVPLCLRKAYTLFWNYAPTAR